MTEERTVSDAETPIWNKTWDSLTQEERACRTRKQSPQNQQALDEIIKEHQLWLNTNGRQGAAIDLSHKDLSGAFLDATIFNGAHARGLQLVSADLLSANLYKANIKDARISSEGLADAVLVGDSDGTFTARINKARAKSDLPNWEWDPRDR